MTHINIFRVFCGDGGGRGGGGGYHRKAHPCAEHCKANMMIIFLKPLKTQNLALRGPSKNSQLVENIYFVFENYKIAYNPQ